LWICKFEFGGATSEELIGDGVFSEAQPPNNRQQKLATPNTRDHYSP